jgi:hypothetical protein
MPTKLLFYLSLLLALLLAFVSAFALSKPDFYGAETPNWQLQSWGQDLVDLFLLVPVLLFTSLMLLRKKPWAPPIWAGTVLYLAYTFVLYCFDVHFNVLFLFYCAGLGLAVYSFLFYLLAQSSQLTASSSASSRLSRFTGYYFISIALLFALLWLSEIIPSILHGTLPKSLAEAGLFTNGVHVLDLALLLPGVFICGIWLLKDRRLGQLLAPVFLSFFVLMTLTIGTLAYLMKIKGFVPDFTLCYIMAALAVFSLFILIFYLKQHNFNHKNETLGSL